MLNRKGGLIIGIYNYFDIRFSQKYRKHRIYTHSYCQDFGWMLGNRKISWKVFFLRKSFSFILGVRLYLKHIIGTDTAKLPESLTNGSLSKEATPIRLIQPVLIDPSAKISPGLAKWIVIKLLLSTFPGCYIGPNVCIGANVKIDEGVRLLDSTILPDTTIHSHSYIAHSIVGRKCVIGK